MLLVGCDNVCACCRERERPTNNIRPPPRAARRSRQFAAPLPPIASQRGGGAHATRTPPPAAPTPTTARFLTLSTHRVVAVLDAADELLEKVARLVLAKAPRLDDAVEQLAAGGVLHDDAEVRGREVDLLEADDVDVVEHPMVEDLALDVLVDLGVWRVGGAHCA